jgi:hypothetical protein
MWGVLAILAGCWFWHSLIGNPLYEIALIRRAIIASGTLVATHEEKQEDYRGHVYVSDVGVYAYRLPDGREFKAITRAPTGHLKEQRLIEYLPYDPAVNRIKGDGCQGVVEWLWRKAGLGALLLAAFVSPGVIMIRNGMRRLLGKTHS